MYIALPQTIKIVKYKCVTYILLFCLFFMHAFAVPANAFLGFGEFGIKDEKEMGHKFEVLVRSQLPLVEDPEVRLYIEGLVKKISKVIPPQPFTFSSGVILHNALNAFAVPGGHIFVFTGLIMQLENEAELAGIIAHEMAHVTQRHVASRIERGKYLTLASLLVAIAGIAAGGAGGGALAAGAIGAGQSAMLNYSRLDENEADDIGYQYLVAAGYPPMGMAGGFEKIRSKSFMSGGGNIPTYLSTHPELGARITSVMAKAQSGPQKLNARKVDNRQFKRVQTLLWGRYGTPQAAHHRFNADKSPLAHMGQGMVYAREHKIPEATAAFALAVQQAPKDSLVLREAGIFHYRKGDTSKAETLLTTAMHLDSRDYMAQFFYARLLDETGRAHQAQPYYIEVLRILPQDQEVHAAYARSLGRSGQEFAAYLHLAYSSLYANNKSKTKQYFEKAQSLVQSSAHKSQLQRFETQYKERKEIWDEGL